MTETYFIGFLYLQELFWGAGCDRILSNSGLKRASHNSLTQANV